MIKTKYRGVSQITLTRHTNFSANQGKAQGLSGFLDIPPENCNTLYLFSNALTACGFFSVLVSHAHTKKTIPLVNSTLLLFGTPQFLYLYHEEQTSCWSKRSNYCVEDSLELVGRLTIFDCTNESTLCFQVDKGRYRYQDIVQETKAKEKSHEKDQTKDWQQ
jgi:hypothetical protein